MKSTTTAGACAAVGFLGFAAPGWATTPVPVATGYVQCLNADGSNFSDPSSCAATYDSATRTLSPFAGLTAQATYPGDFDAVSAGAIGFLTYYFTVDGPGPSVEVDIDTRLTQSTVNGGYGFSEILVTAGTDIFTAPNSAYEVICSSGCSDDATALDTTLQITTNPGYVSSVDLEIEAGTGFSANPIAGYASADPFIFIDPSVPDASAYTITLSPGVANGLPGMGGVPEPATWAMMLAGLGLAGAQLRDSHRRRRSRSARNA